MALREGSRLGPYEVVALLGAGGMGEVYRARDPRMGRDAAIKVLPSQFAENAERLRRFELEARTAGSLNHPNILVVYDIGSHEQSPYLVSELLEGQTLREKLNSGALSVRRATDYAQQAARGLAAAHDKGIIHRDLKPENLFVTHEEHLKILDFGLAKLTRQEKDGLKSSVPTTPLSTEAGSVMGTVGYMAPEQVRGEPADQRSDIFALGCVLYEMLSGKRAFHAATAVETMTAILKSDPPEITSQNANISPALERVVLHCLEKNPAQRFQSARDLAFAIEALSGATSVASGQATAVTQRRLAQRLTWVLAAMVFLAAILWVLLTRNPQQEPSMIVSSLMPSPGAAYEDFQGVWLSPDGKYLAFGESNSLWLRPLNSLVAQKLVDLVRANAISIGAFWAPDSKTIAYFNAGKLRKIAIAGGQPQTICDAPAGRGGTWNSEGTMVFAPGSTGGLFRVTADGGTPEPVTQLEAEEQGHRFPSFLPDGDHFVFSVQTLKSPNPLVYLGSLKNKTKSLLIENAMNPLFSQGHLLFVRDGTLLAQSFNLKSLKTTSDPQPAVPGRIAYLRLAAIAFYSVSRNGLLAYESSELYQSQLHWFDRAGNDLGSVIPVGTYDAARISPDGTRVAYVKSGVDYSDSDLWILDLARGQSSRLTSHPADYWTPVWSPDGNRIAYSTDFYGGVKSFVVSLVGPGKEELLYDSKLPVYINSWSQDGQFLSLQTQAPGTNGDIWILPFASRKPEPFLETAFWETNSIFSPNGRWIAYASDESGMYEVYIRSRLGSGLKYQISAEGGRMPRFNRDGSELYYIARDHKIMMTPIQNDLPGKPQLLFQTKEDFDDYDVAGDGERFLINMTIKQPPYVTTLVQNWPVGLQK